jgi:LSD1 subclass zinc finger protein
MIEMKRYLVTPLLLTLLAMALAYPQQFLSGSGVVAQKRGSRRAAKPQATRNRSTDYSKFSHATKQHQAACNTCHKIPTSNWRKAAHSPGLDAFPDVADYPEHDTCISCHRPQFFKGAKPVICSICHSKVSPRDDARFAFRKPAGPRQFMIEFPHDKHQDVIARLFRPPTQPRFVRASFIAASFYPDDKTKHYNNCEICHGPRAAPSIAPASGWVDSFVPDDLTLKSVPANHATCFSCHWKSEQPVNNNCAGCHKLPNPPVVLAVDDLPKRKSMKFRHGREQHIDECTTCHINITKATTLIGLKPDVPITPCTTCHNKDGQRFDLSNELKAIDKNRDFVCVYCHTSDVGRRDPPASHYLSAGRTAVKRGDLK